MIRISILAIFLISFSSCVNQSGKEYSHKESIKLDQYLVEGQKLYLQYCSNCHQVEGQGLAKLFPPLKDSDFLKENFELSVCSMKYGLQGEIEVNGIVYNQNMPGLANLTPLEIAEITTYIMNSWGNDAGLIEVDSVEQILKRCKN